ncbi:MAG TPA: hypothetical protein VN032_00145 [Thermoanaerobaculia bacterium]|jgi:hypothetical protein|nr:hypothetical protein [Thermoanaerobaculia bacterium]
MMIEDFMRLPVGSLVSGSRPVIECPVCRRRGALDRLRNGAWRCVHVEASLIYTDGMVIEPRDHCELQQPAGPGLAVREVK